MKVITFSQRVAVNTTVGGHVSELTCNPGERLIFDDDNALAIQSNATSASYILEVSDLAPMLAEIPRPVHYKKRRVLFYRNRGIGDQLIVSAVARFFREVLGADARVLSDKVHESVWLANPYIGNVPLSTPLHLDAVYRYKGRPFFDASFFIESATEWETDQEQPNVYDRIFAMCGVDPDRVPAKYKRPVFSLIADDLDKRAAFMKQYDGTARGYIMVQLRAANVVRSIPAETARVILEAVNEAAKRRGLSVFVTDDKPLSDDLAMTVSELPALYNVACKIPTARLFGALVCGAACVVGPDSSALHFAAAAETPALGIFGPFDPDSRIKYYPNMIALHHTELCANSPCFNYLPVLPVHKCPRGAAQKTCEVFAGVTADEVLESIDELLPVPHG